MSNLKSEFENNINEFENISYQLNKYIAENPELSGEEHMAYQKYVDILNEQNIFVEERFCDIPTAFKATLFKSKQPRIRIAILAEYDALPELGHACGHSASGSISLLAGLSLSKTLIHDKHSVQIDLIGTPDEELHGLKVKMVENGIFKDYNFAIMVHLNSNQTIIRPEFVAMDAFDLIFTGKSAHAAAAPWDGINALDALQLTFHAIDLLRQQSEPNARISYFIKEGGSASNIITDYASCQIEFRHENSQKLNVLKEKIINCIKGAAIATGNQYEIKEIGYEYKDFLPNEYGEGIIRSTLEELGMTYTTDIIPTGSSDIGNVSYECPAFHPLLKTSEEYFSLHTQEMVNVVKGNKINDIINEGAKLIGYSIINLIEDDSGIDNIEKEFLKRKNV